MLDINDLFEAIYEGDLSVLQQEADVHGIDPNTVHQDGGHTFLQAACQADCIDVIVLLLSLGADPNKRITRLDIGGRVIEQNSVALSSAKSEAVASLLFDHGADINYVDGFGFTPLIWAARRRDVSMVRFYCENGADYHAKLNIKENLFTPKDFVLNEIDKYKEILGESLTEKQSQFMRSYEEIVELLEWFD